MSEPEPVRAIDAVVNIWTPEALAQRPDWGPDFFAGTQSVLPIVTRFRRDLHALEERIAARNAGLDVPYPYLAPHQVACSITA